MTHTTAANINIVNPDDETWTRSRFIMQFGPYGDTLLMVWADHLQDALDESIDWLVEHEPGLLCDGEVANAYCDAIAEGHTRDDAYEISLQDVTIGGNCGNCIASHEWGVRAENPSRADILAIQGR